MGIRRLQPKYVGTKIEMAKSSVEILTVTDAFISNELNMKDRFGMVNRINIWC